jgi:hypothetical protein
MLNVKVLSPALRIQPYTDKKTGQPRTIAFQTAWIYTVDEEGKPGPFPEKIEFIPPRPPGAAPDAPPQAYGPGDYTLHPSAVYLDRDGRLAAQMRLTPLKRAA